MRAIPAPYIFSSHGDWYAIALIRCGDTPQTHLGASFKYATLAECAADADLIGLPTSDVVCSHERRLND